MTWLPREYGFACDLAAGRLQLSTWRRGTAELPAVFAVPLDGVIAGHLRLAAWAWRDARAHAEAR